MIASNVSEATIRNAASDVGVRVEMTQLSSTGRRWRVKVYPSGKRNEAGNYRWQRRSANGFTPERRVHAVCWHGFRDFFRACYKREENARFYTALDKWLGSDDFEARFEASGYRNIGSLAYPCSAEEACFCHD